MFKPDRGFTLVELLVAIAIVSVLTTAGAVVYSQAQVSARDSKRRSDILEIQKALEQHYAINKNYPNTLDGVGSFFQSGSVPTPPSGSYDYYYKIPSGTCDEEKYILCATLERCGSSCTKNNAPTNSCTDNAGASAAGNTIYCVSSLSN